MDLSSKDIVAVGTWMYSGSVPCKIVISKESIIPGSGDYEDAPELQKDRAVECFAVWYQAAGDSGSTFKAGRGGYYLTLIEAKNSALIRVGPSLKWE